VDTNFQTRYFSYAFTQMHVTRQGVGKKETDERGGARLGGEQDKRGLPPSCIISYTLI